MVQRCWFFLVEIILLASVVAPTYDSRSHIRNADTSGIAVNPLNSIAIDPDRSSTGMYEPSVRTNYVGTMTFVSDKRGSKWFAIVDREIYCPLSTLADGIPANTKVIEGAMVRIDAKWAKGNQNPWTCTKIHDLWITGTLQPKDRQHGHVAHDIPSDPAVIHQGSGQGPAEDWAYPSEHAAFQDPRRGAYAANSESYAFKDAPLNAPPAAPQGSDRPEQPRPAPAAYGTDHGPPPGWAEPAPQGPSLYRAPGGRRG